MARTDTVIDFRRARIVRGTRRVSDALVQPDMRAERKIKRERKTATGIKKIVLD